jgi:hypothetical protein
MGGDAARGPAAGGSSQAASQWQGGAQQGWRALLSLPPTSRTHPPAASVNKAPSVKRVVLTSSIAAILSYPEAGKTYNEDGWWAAGLGRMRQAETGLQQVLLAGAGARFAGLC